MSVAWNGKIPHPSSGSWQPLFLEEPGKGTKGLRWKASGFDYWDALPTL